MSIVVDSYVPILGSDKQSNQLAYQMGFQFDAIISVKCLPNWMSNCGSKCGARENVDFYVLSLVLTTKLAVATSKQHLDNIIENYSTNRQNLSWDISNSVSSDPIHLKAGQMRTLQCSTIVLFWMEPTVVAAVTKANKHTLSAISISYWLVFNSDSTKAHYPIQLNRTYARVCKREKTQNRFRPSGGTKWKSFDLKCVSIRE